MPAPHARKSAVPVPKIQAVGAAGAVTVIVVYVAGLLGLDVPPTVSAALTILISAGAGYLKS